MRERRERGEREARERRERGEREARERGEREGREIKTRGYEPFDLWRHAWSPQRVVSVVESPRHIYGGQGQIQALVWAIFQANVLKTFQAVA